MAVESARHPVNQLAKLPVQLQIKSVKKIRILIKSTYLNKNTMKGEKNFYLFTFLV